MKDFSKYKNCAILVCIEAFEIYMFGTYKFDKGEVYNITVEDKHKIIVISDKDGCYFHCEDDNDYSLIENKFSTINDLIAIKELSDRRGRISIIF